MLLLLVGVASCKTSSTSSGNGNPNPGAPTPTVSSIAINLQNTVRAGTSVTASATATLSNGQTEAVATGWRSDAPTVASITDGGAITAHANGEATITVSRGAAQASRRIRVTPNYEGRWAGQLRVGSCAATGGYVGLCEYNGGVIGMLIPVTLTLRHSGDLTVSVELAIDVLAYAPTTSQIEGDGRIRFATNGSYQATTSEASADVNVVDGRLNGTARERYTAYGLLAGTVTFDSTLVDVVRTGPAAAATPPMPIAGLPGRVSMTPAIAERLARWRNR
jgi:hypothetical protein